jgi:agmatinase
MTRTYLGLSAAEGATPEAPYLILPVPYEQTVSYGRGCARGPEAILQASQEVELFDEELETEVYRAGIGTLASQPPTAAGPEAMVEMVRDRCGPLVRDGKFVIMLGGEHSLTPGPVRAYQEIYPDLSVLQIDAHADLRESYQDCPYSHASALRRVRDTVTTTVGVGIRNISAPEFEYYRHTEGCQLHFAHKRDAAGAWMKEAVDQLSEHVYVTIDLDGLDAGIMPAVGTPEPGGLSWQEVCALLRLATERRQVVGGDVVELAPIGGIHAPDFLAAKLVYKFIGYVERSRGSTRSSEQH